MADRKRFIKITNKARLKEIEIKEEITKEVMDKRLKLEQSEGVLRGGEQCFRSDYPWYRLNIGYTNPLNFGEVHAELELIKKNLCSGSSASFLSYFKNSHLIFYGVGVGDTEIAFVDGAVKSGQKEVWVTGIDVNKTFLKNFAIALENRTFEPDEPVFQFCPRHALFEQVTQQELKVPGVRNTHICLGGTIGNFHNQEFFFKLISKLVLPDDFLILGFQLKYNLEWIFEKYKTNPLFSDFILNYLPKEERGGIAWSMDKKKGTITAVHNGVGVFRTTKYVANELKSIVEKYSFEFVYQDVDKYNNSCLQVYKRI